MAQLEDELAGQQHQLNTMRKTLSNVVDVATLRLHQEFVATELANKADLEALEKRYADCRDAQLEGLSEALANKADAVELEKCQRELSRSTQDVFAAIEHQQVQLKHALAESSADAEKLRSHYDHLLNDRAELSALELHQKALDASLAEKADMRIFAEQERRLAKIESAAQSLQRSVIETAQEQLSSRLSAEMSSEVLHKATAAALEQQREALEATKAEVASVQQSVWMLEEQQMGLNEQAIAKQDEWYREKDHEQYLLAVARKEKQEHQLSQVLAKKADLCWYEQQQAIIEATQVSLAALNDHQKELQERFLEKADTSALQKQQKQLQQEIAEARQDTSDVSKKLDRHREHLDMARAQLLEMIRQQGEVEVSLSMMADKAVLEKQAEQLESLFAKVALLEQRQDAALREFGHLRDLVSASRRSMVHSPHPQGALPTAPGGMKTILQPPSSPCEKLHPGRSKASPYSCNRKPGVHSSNN